MCIYDGEEQAVQGCGEEVFDVFGYICSALYNEST
jgi:hypothetical protein